MKIFFHQFMNQLMEDEIQLILLKNKQNKFKNVE